MFPPRSPAKAAVAVGAKLSPVKVAFAKNLTVVAYVMLGTTPGLLFLCIRWWRRPLKSLGGGTRQGKAAQENQVTKFTWGSGEHLLGTVFQM